uniref:trypsin n=1 Tax=Sinocyclocheilus grahami TaxID=75366 RepID=A0A672LFV9_SINGR
MFMSLTNSSISLSARVDVGIVNGKQAKPHSRPYMVSIQNNFKHICGGFLISDEFVMTAAHYKVLDYINAHFSFNRYPDILTVVVGAHDLRKSEISDRVEVKSYIPHPYYPFCSSQNDIMLLRLQEKVKLNNDVKWISLPKEGDVNGDTLCSVAGWGRLWTNGILSSRLMEANMTTINHTVCQHKWGSKYLASEMICGDSGGPLVCGNTAVGVTSFGSRERCNSLKHPNVYTKISAYLPWIHQIIRNIK